MIKVAEQLGYEIIPGHAALSDRPRQIAIVFDRIAGTTIGCFEGTISLPRS